MISIYICDDNQSKLKSFTPNETIIGLIREKAKLSKLSEADYCVSCITIVDGHFSLLSSGPDGLQTANFVGNYFLLMDDDWSLYDGEDAKSDLINAVAQGANKVFVVLYSTFHSIDTVQQDTEKLRRKFESNVNVKICERCMGFSNNSPGFRYFSREAIELLPEVEAFFNG